MRQSRDIHATLTKICTFHATIKGSPPCRTKCGGVRHWGQPYNLGGGARACRLHGTAAAQLDVPCDQELYGCNAGGRHRAAVGQQLSAAGPSITGMPTAGSRACVNACSHGRQPVTTWSSARQSRHCRAVVARVSRTCPVAVPHFVRSMFTV